MTEQQRLFDDIHAEIASTDTIDAHTHINWDTPQTQTGVPLLFYHFVHFEMTAAGLKEWTDHIRDKDVKDFARRAKQALPYFEMIRLGGSYYCLKRILQDLFGMKTECPTAKFIDELDERIKSTRADRNWPRQVLAKARIKRASVNIVEYRDWPGRMKAGDPKTCRYADIFFPAIEQGAFVLFDVRRLLRVAEKRSKLRVTGAESLAHAVRHHATAAEWKSIKSFLGWATMDFIYGPADLTAADAAIKKALRGEPTTTEENCAVQNLCVDALFKELTPRGIPFQIFFGSEYTPRFREPAVAAYRDQVLLNVAAMAIDHPEQQIELLLGAHAYSQEANILAKNLPNVRVTGIWWHNMYPAYIRRIIEERLDVCPLNKVNAFFSDAYCVEWAYGKRQLVQREFARVMADRVAQGYLSRNDASEVIRRWWWENPRAAYGVK